MNFNQDRAEKLMSSIMTNPNSAQSGILINDLLREFHRGYPVNNLYPLLHSHNQTLVTIGAWIASELGERGKPLLRDIFGLLTHRSKEVRFDAIDCILVWADPSNEVELAAAIKLLDDPEASVRWKVMDFLSRATPGQLQAALRHLESTEPENGNIQGLRWLLGTDAKNSKEVMAALQNENGLMRKYGVAAARRLSSDDKEPLLYAASVDDSDIRDFANSSIKLL